MQAAILAGGLGTRLRPLTYRVPKPMIPVGNKPFLYYQLKLLKRYGILDVLLLVGYLGQQIEDYFDNGRKLGMRIRYSFEPKPLGTGGSLKLAEKLLKNEFFVVYADSYLPINYKKLGRYFKRSGKWGLLVAYDNRVSTGVSNNLALDKNFNVIRYRKGAGSEPALRYAEAGVSIFKKQILKHIKPGKTISLEKDVFPKLIKAHQLIAYVSRQRFYDLGTPGRLKEIEEVLR